MRRRWNFAERDFANFCFGKMIRSSVFSFDESSIWDPKAIRQQLNIPEDQLNILNNIPDWSVSKDDDRASRIEIDTCEHSHSTTLHISYKNLPKSQPSKKDNTKLFEEHFETQRSILASYKVKAQKFCKSVSLFEIDKISQDSPSTNLKSALSLPNLYLFSSESSCIQNHNMEMISQLPVDVPNRIDKVQTSESNFEVIIEKNIPNSQNLQASYHSNNSDQPAILENSNKSDNNGFNVSEKSNKVAESGSCDSYEKNEIIPSIVSVTVPNSHNTVVSEKSDTINSLVVLPEKFNTDVYDGKETTFSKNYRKAVENAVGLSNSKDAKLCEKDGQKMIVTSGTVLEEVNSGIESKNTDDIEAQQLAQTNEICDKSSNSLGASNKLESPRNELVSSNECKKISCGSDNSKMDIEYTKKTIHQKVGDKSVHTEILSVKRKSESKSRSSKKHRSSREKQGDSDKRGLKKAGEIYYSVEQVKSMLDIMKQFL